MAFSVNLGILLIFLLIYNFYFINKNKWINVFCCLYFLILMIPIEAQGIISGTPYNTAGIFNISLASYDIIIVGICTLFTRKKIKNISKNKFVSLIICLLVLIGMRFLADGISAPSNKMFDNYGLPVLSAILMVSFLEKKDLKKIFSFIYFLILFNAAIACIELFLGKSVFFHNYYLENILWYNNIYKSTYYGVAFRCTSLLGHPLTNGTYFIIAIAYLYNKTNMKLSISAIFQLLILTLAIIATNSRIAIAVFILYTMYMLIKRKQIGKIIFLTLIFIIFLVNIDFSNLYASLFSRDATGSSLLVRLMALKKFFSIPFETLLLGTGYNSTSIILSTLGFSSNLEVSFLIILLENGLISFCAWLKLIISLYNTKMIPDSNGMNLKSTINGMILCTLIVISTSNSIGDPGTLNYIFWSLFAFSTINSSVKEVKETKE